MLKKIALVFVVALVGLLTYAGFQSPDYHIAREIEIQASPEQIFPWINDIQKTNAWMPWADSDPEMKMTYSGPTEGTGSKASWQSTGPMGVGEALVVDSQANTSVKTQLTYREPMEMQQLAEVALSPTAAGTKVTWSVKGQNSFLGRLVCIFMDMDKMVGPEFEKGLNKLKTLVEAP